MWEGWGHGSILDVSFQLGPAERWNLNRLEGRKQGQAQSRWCWMSMTTERKGVFDCWGNVVLLLGL